MDRSTNPATIFSFCQADPALAALTWKDPDDLSAKIWAWKKRQGPASTHRCTRRRPRCRKKKPPTSGAATASNWRSNIRTVPAFFEIGAARGQTDRFTARLDRPDWPQHRSEDFDVACKDIPGGLRYELALPYGKFGLTDAIREKGFRFNLIVNGQRRHDAGRVSFRIAPPPRSRRNQRCRRIPRLLRLPTNK